MITVDDLTPGLELDVPNQGTNITPTTIKVKIAWVGNGTVYYSRNNGLIVGSTPVTRFLSIANQGLALHADKDLNDAWWKEHGVTVGWHERPVYQVHKNSIRDGSGRYDGYLVHYHGQDMRTVRTISEAKQAVVHFQSMPADKRAELEATKARHDSYHTEKK